MKHTVIIECRGIGVDACEYVNPILEQLRDNTRVVFSAGEYLIGTALVLRGKRNIEIDGSGAVLLQRFCAEEYGTASSDIMHVEDCEGICLRGFIVDADSPINTSGYLSAVEDEYIDFRIHDGVPFTGREKYIAGYTLRPEGYPAYGLVMAPDKDPEQWDYIGGLLPTARARDLDVRHEKVDEHTVRIYFHPFEGEEHRFYVGAPFCMRHSYYGPVAFRFVNVLGALIEDINLRAFGGFGFAIFPRSADFTFRRVTIAPESAEKQFFSTNADGIRSLGMMGKLRIESCVFKNLGDDCVNNHSRVYAAHALTKKSFSVKENSKHFYLPENWAQKGDLLYVYDPFTLEKKRDVQVERYEDGVVYCASETDICEGDHVLNSAYYPDITIEKCISYNMRGRAFVIQGARSLVMRGCEFYNVTGAALYMSSAFQFWREGGPISNAEIYDNRMYGAKGAEDTSIYGVIHAWINGKYDERKRNTHKNICVHDNTFVDPIDIPIRISDTDGVRVYDNTFIGSEHEENVRIL